MRIKCRILLAQILCAIGFLFAGVGGAQDFPNRTIRIIVPSTAGNSPDHVARIMAAEMSKILGQPIVVENRPGADGILAYEYVAKQVPPDGYTLAVVTVPGLAGLPATVKDLRFDPLKDLPPLISVAETRYIFGSSPKFPWKSFNEMIDNAKANPGKLNYGFTGANLRLLNEVFIQELGLNIVNVPYKGGAPYIQAVIAAEVQMGFLGEGSAITAGERFRPLAATGEGRRAPYLDIPTFAELGYPQIRGPSFSLNLPVGVPKPAFDKLYAAASRALQQPDVKDRFAKLQFEIAELAPDAAGKRLAEEAQLYSSIAKKAGIQPQ